MMKDAERKRQAAEQKSCWKEKTHPPLISSDLKGEKNKSGRFTPRWRKSNDTEAEITFTVPGEENIFVGKSQKNSRGDHEHKKEKKRKKKKKKRKKPKKKSTREKGRSSIKDFR